jgi:hypothetical protein
MRLIAQALALASLFTALPAAAVVVEVPVPELAGTYVDYTSSEVRTATIHLPALPSEIHGVSVRVIGTTQFSTYSCDGAPPHVMKTAIETWMFADQGYWVVWHVHDTPGAISWTEPFEANSGATWDFLLDGVGEMWFHPTGASPIPECLLVGSPSSTTIESVTLLVDGEFPTPAQAVSWGRVKASYR